MFWEYHADRTGALLDTLDAALRGEDVRPALRRVALRARPRRRGAPRLLGEPQPRPDGSAFPGVLQAQGFGDDVTVDTKWTGQIVDRSWFTAPKYAQYRQPGNVKVPFWLQPDKHYVGAAWYQRDVEIPADWQGKRVVLSLERPHWETRVWLDGRTVGSNDSLSTPHVYDLGTGSRPGKHRLTIRVDNRMVVDVGDELAQRHRPHAGQLERHRRADRAARRRRRCGSTTCRCIPTSAHDRSTVAGRDRQRHRAGRPRRDRASTCARPTARRARAATDVERRRGTPTGGTFEVELSARRAAPRLWDEFTPALYRLTADARRPARRRDSATTVRPARDRHAGHAVRRSTAARSSSAARWSAASSRKTGHPPTDVESWKRIIRHRQGARAEPYPLPLLVPAGSRVRRGRRTGLLLTRSSAPPGRTSPPRSATASRWTSGSTTRPTAS